MEVLRKQLICERCKQPIQKLKEDINGPINWDTPWEQYLCEECYEKIWNNLIDDCCPRCRTHPCEHGRDCWINPWPQIMYLCYVAPKVNQMSKIQIDIDNNVLHPRQEILDVYGVF